MTAKAALDLPMPPRDITAGEPQTAHEGVSEHGPGAAGHDETLNMHYSQSDDHEPLELVTALGVFDPDRVFASALDIDFQDQWVCS